MATIKIKRNKSDASAKPTSLQEGELAVNLLDKSLFSGNGSGVVKLYTGEDKYFNEDGFANKALDATKLGGQLPSYYATAAALEALREEIGGGADTSNLATKEELAECEEVTAAALNELNDRSTFIQSELENKMDKVVLAVVATSGSYNDLSNKPTIPDVSGKQDTLVSGTNIKTINGVSILGEGDIEVGADVSALATKEELAESEEVTAAALVDLNDKIKALEQRIKELEAANQNV